MYLRWSIFRSEWDVVVFTPSQQFFRYQDNTSNFSLRWSCPCCSFPRHFKMCTVDHTVEHFIKCENNKQWCLTIHPTLIQWTTTCTSHLTSLNNDMCAGVNPGHGTRQARKCALVKPVNSIPTFHFFFFQKDVVL